MIQIEQRETVLTPMMQPLQFTTGKTQEVPAITQAGQLVRGGQVFQLTHHATQRVLMRLQGKTPLAHTLTHGLGVTGKQTQPHQHHGQHTRLHKGRARLIQLQGIGFIQVQAGKAEEGKQRATGEDPRRQLKHAE